MSERSDKQKKRVDCRNRFTLLVREQVYFETKGLQEPKRCPPCRDAKRQAKRSQGA